MQRPTLHHSLVRDKEASPTRAALILHGILGSGSNLRSLAQRLVRADPGLVAVLVDLRMHGRSQGFPPPHTVDACAQDLLALEGALDLPVRQVLGHSFGGKVALAYHQSRPDLERLMLLDSAPGARLGGHGSEETLAILDMLEGLPKQYARREQFMDRVIAAGHSRLIAEWLAMNLERTSDGFALRLSVDAIRAMVSDYFALDLWPVLEGSTARVDVVIGGRSAVFQPADKARLEALAQRKPDQVRVHVLPQAGHWVHVDAPEELAAALTR